MRALRRWVVGLAAAACLGAAFAPAAFANGIVVEAGGEVVAGAGRTPVVLTSHRVTAVLHDRLADVTVEQTFRNRIDARLEGVYLFPLPDGAVVARFAMTMGGKMVEGQVIAAAEARKVYESIVRRHRDPGLLEYAGRGLYRASVFPIEPRGEVRVRLTFQEVLAEDAGTLEFRYPLATDRLNGEPVESVAVDVRVESEVDLKAVYSASHEVVVTHEGERKARVTWSRTRAVEDRDFLLYVGRSPDAVGFSLASDKAGTDDGTFLAVLAPRVAVPAGERAPKDVVFVLDTSGSMEGGKLVQAKKAIAAGIDGLRPIDRFRLITFSTSVVPWRDGFVAAEPEARKAACAWLESRPATGGTDLDGALVEALAAHGDGRLMLVVFVTDGLPTVGDSDPDDIVRNAMAANAAHARVFTFGVGSDLNVNLLDRVAEGTGGARDYVTGGEDLRRATQRFYAKVSDPVLVDVHVELGEGVYDVYPRRIPDLFAGGQIVLFGRYREAGARKITLHGTVGGQAVVFESTGTLRADAGPAFLPRLWAQRKVAFLLDEIRLHGAADELTKEVVRLGTRFAIVTPYTSGLVVEDAELEGGVAHAPPEPRGGVHGGAAPPFTPGVPATGGMRSPTDPFPPPHAPPTFVPASPGAPLPPPPTTPSDPTTPMPPPGYTGPGGAVGRSQELKKKKEAGTAEATDSNGRPVRTISGRTFVRHRDGRWIDTAWGHQGRPTQIPAYSDAYFRLLAKGDEIARIFALGDQVLFVFEGTAYEIVPADPAPTGKAR